MPPELPKSVKTKLSNPKSHNRKNKKQKRLANLKNTNSSRKTILTKILISPASITSSKKLESRPYQKFSAKNNHMNHYSSHTIKDKKANDRPVFNNLKYQHPSLMLKIPPRCHERRVGSRQLIKLLHHRVSALEGNSKTATLRSLWTKKIKKAKKMNTLQIKIRRMK